MTAGVIRGTALFKVEGLPTLSLGGKTLPLKREALQNTHNESNAMTFDLSLILQRQTHRSPPYKLTEKLYFVSVLNASSFA